MDSITFWQDQGTSFGLKQRPALSGNDEQSFKKDVDGTERAFEALCAEDNNSPYCPQTQTDAARFFQAFHHAACQAYFPAREENTGVEELLLWFPERNFLDLNMNNTSLSLTFEVAEDCWLSVEMTKSKSKFLFSWDLSRLVDRVEIHGEVAGKQSNMERWGRKVYPFETYEQAVKSLFELVKTGHFSHDVFPQKFFLSPDLEISKGTIKVCNGTQKKPVLPKRFKKPALPERFKKLILNSEECMEMNSSGCIHFQVKSGGTFFNATVICGWDQSLTPEQPFVSYYWSWTEDRWEEGYGWLDSEKDSVRSIDCLPDQLSETFYRCLLLMFDGVTVRGKGFYQALFGTHAAEATVSGK